MGGGLGGDHLDDGVVARVAGGAELGDGGRVGEGVPHVRELEEVLLQDHAHHRLHPGLPLGVSLERRPQGPQQPHHHLRERGGPSEIDRRSPHRVEEWSVEECGQGGGDKVLPPPSLQSKSRTLGLGLVKDRQDTARPP